jgi:hypothetical protein
MHEIVITCVRPDNMTGPEVYAAVENALSEFHVTDIFIREM